jgi:hypothetical protein
MPNARPERLRPSSGQLRELAAASRLELAESRAVALLPTMALVHGMMDALWQVSLGDTPPAGAFSPRWAEEAP